MLLHASGGRSYFMNIKEFLCSHEECIEMVKEGIDLYTQKEMYALLDNHGLYSSLSKTIRHRFCGSNVDEHNNIYLFDELSPRKITEHFIGEDYQVREDVLYALVCQVLMNEINEFYKNLDSYKKEGMLAYRTNKCPQNIKRFNKLYIQAAERRIEAGYKRIRRSTCYN